MPTSSVRVGDGSARWFMPCSPTVDLDASADEIGAVAQANARLIDATDRRDRCRRHDSAHRPPTSSHAASGKSAGAATGNTPPALSRGWHPHRGRSRSCFSGGHALNSMAGPWSISKPIAKSRMLKINTALRWRPTSKPSISQLRPRPVAFCSLSDGLRLFACTEGTWITSWPRQIQI